MGGRGEGVRGARGVGGHVIQGHLMAALEALSVIAPDLVASELRPVVESLQARRRTCHRCGRDYVSKSMTLRSRFCTPACRKQRVSHDAIHATDELMEAAVRAGKRWLNGGDAKVGKMRPAP